MSNNRRATLSSSLVVYVTLIKYTQTIKEDPIAQANPNVMTGADVCRDKLMKYFDLSSFESEYYYFACGQFNFILVSPF